MYETGCQPPILGNTTTSPADHNTAVRRNVLFGATCSQHGKCPIRVLFYGSMENIYYYPVFSFSETVSFLVAGAGECLMVL